MGAFVMSLDCGKWTYVSYCRQDFKVIFKSIETGKLLIMRSTFVHCVYVLRAPMCHIFVRLFVQLMRCMAYIHSFIHSFNHSHVCVCVCTLHKHIPAANAVAYISNSLISFYVTYNDKMLLTHEFLTRSMCVCLLWNEPMNKRTNEQMDGWTDIRTHTYAETLKSSYKFSEYVHRVHHKSLHVQMAKKARGRRRRWQDDSKRMRETVCCHLFSCFNFLNAIYTCMTSHIQIHCIIYRKLC